MTKKVFLQKGARPGRGEESRGHLKFLLWAAMLLVVLVVAAPLFTKDKNDTKTGKDISALPEGDKGAVVREMPRALQLMGQGALEGDSMPRGVLEDGGSLHGFEGDGAQTTGSALAVKPFSQRLGGPGSGEEGVPEEGGWIDIPRDGYMSAEHESTASEQPRERVGGAQSEKETTATGTGAGGSHQPTDSVRPPELAGQQPPVSTVQTASQKPPSPAVSTSARVPQPKPERLGPSSGSTSMAYSVQVGSFKERSNALKLKKALVDKGYQVVIRQSHHPSLGPMHVVQLGPVPDMARASTLLEQVRMEEQVSPFLVHLPGEE